MRIKFSNNWSCSHNGDTIAKNVKSRSNVTTKIPSESLGANLNAPH